MVVCAPVGASVGAAVGARVGVNVGAKVGLAVGKAVGESDVATVGAAVGTAVGTTVSSTFGVASGTGVGADASRVGASGVTSGTDAKGVAVASVCLEVSLYTVALRVDGQSCTVSLVTVSLVTVSLVTVSLVTVALRVDGPSSPSNAVNIGSWKAPPSWRLWCLAGWGSVNWGQCRLVRKRGCGWRRFGRQRMGSLRWLWYVGYLPALRQHGRHPWWPCAWFVVGRRHGGLLRRLQYGGALALTVPRVVRRVGRRFWRQLRLLATFQHSGTAVRA